MLQFLQWVSQPIWSLSFGVNVFATYSQNQNPAATILWFILEFSQVLLISTVRSLDDLVVIKTQIVVPQKLDISDFRGIKYNDDAANSYLFVGSINFEGNSSTTGHYVAYLKCSTGVIKINDSNIQHYSDSVLESKQFISTTHTLFCVSTSCLESENKVLQDYVLRLSLQRQVQDIILGYSEPTLTFISRKPIDLCISGKLNDEIINDFFTFLERSFSDINCLPTKCYLEWERKRCSGVVKLVFDKEDVMSRPLYIPVNENENRWIFVIVFPKYFQNFPNFQNLLFLITP